MCVITEFAPYGDLLGFLRKKRGLRDDYYNIEQLPERNLTSQLLMKFAGEIADGMAHLSSAKVRLTRARFYEGRGKAYERRETWPTKDREDEKRNKFKNGKCDIPLPAFVYSPLLRILDCGMCMALFQVKTQSRTTYMLTGTW